MKTGRTGGGLAWLAALTTIGSARRALVFLATLALAAPVSRIMVRQPQSKANAGAFNNGMPMTSSLGCGTWGGNIVSENVHLKHYMNTTWVSVPIEVDQPSDEELFGDFYDARLETEGVEGEAMVT